jgi:NitT/TauT family transport system ATP-binding protein
MPALMTVEGVSKIYPRSTGKGTFYALQDVSLKINEGEFFMFVGPSGCGKSTLLRILSGLEKEFDGTVEYTKGLDRHSMSFVFQQFALLPWMTVYQNVELALLARGMQPKDCRKLIEGELAQLGLKNFAKAFPRELSGGMRQRVGIARALVTNPRVLFLDEPFSELDSFTASALRMEVLKISRERNLTVVMVSHIVQEAIELADRIAIMHANPGGIETIVQNKLARPREKRSAEFFAMEDKLYKAIKV